MAVSTPALTLLPAACNTNKLVKKYALHLYCAQRHISTQQQYSSTCRLTGLPDFIRCWTDGLRKSRLSVKQKLCSSP